MVLGFFKKSKPDEADAKPAANGGGAAVGGKPMANGGDEGGAFKRDSRKAKRWFEHAQGVADHEYAIDCYLHGLEHEPDHMAAHEALYEVARKRKVAGGKPASFAAKFTGGGRGAVQKFLHAEKLWAFNPLDLSLMLGVMSKAVELDEAEEDLRMGEVAYWIGDLILQSHISKSPTMSNLILLRDLFSKIKAWDKAVDACKMAVARDSGNGQLLKELKDLEAERTISDGGYANAAKKDGSFRDTIRDADKQKALEQDDAIGKTESVVDQTIARRRAEFDEAPEDTDRLQKLVDALQQKESDDTDEESSRLLKEAWERTGQYRFKERIGNIRMRQFDRKLRALKPAASASAEGSEDRRVFHEMAQKKLAFELEEFTERVQNYPTEMRWRYELGRRLFQHKRFDEAIGAFQQSKSDPKWRAASHEYLGQCYRLQGWLDEAIDTLKQGLAALATLPDDKRETEIKYLLLDAYEQSAVKNRNLDHAREAQKLASQIMQNNINFRDIRTRMDKLRKLVEELEKEKK